MKKLIRLPAEWEEQDAVQLIWPDEQTPWYDLPSVQACYVRIISTILKYENVLLVCRNVESVRKHLASEGVDVGNIVFFECPMNDTWARDSGAISVYAGSNKHIVDFIFNGWGLKFASDLDNQINRKMYRGGVFRPEVIYDPGAPIVLEGGSFDTDGQGCIMLTSSCQLSLNRNECLLNKREVGRFLNLWLGIGRRLWLDHGGIIGDDTDGHVDTLARFCSPDTIVYVKCGDPSDPSFKELKAMEADLKRLRTAAKTSYQLVPLPLPEPTFLDGYRLPATYANFLIVNGAVLMPGYGQPSDAVAAGTLTEQFPGRKLEVIDCRPLLSGHGSLHCVTMNYPKGWINFDRK